MNPMELVILLQIHYYYYDFTSNLFWTWFLDEDLFESQRENNLLEDFWFSGSSKNETKRDLNWLFTDFKGSIIILFFTKYWVC